MQITDERLASLLQYLSDDHRFNIGIRERLRAEQLRRMIEESSENFDADAWIRHLAPVVTGSEEEQRALRPAFHSYFTSLTGTRKAETTAFATPSVPGDQSGRKTAIGRLRRYRFPIAVLCLVVAAIGVIFWQFMPSGASGSGGGGFDDVDLDTSGYAPKIEQTAMVVMPWAMFLLFMLWRADRHLFFLRSGGANSAAEKFGDRTRNHFPPVLVAPHLHAFQQRWPKGRPTFHATRTAQTAAARAGYAEPQFQRHTTRPHYIFLVRQRARSDHWAAAGLELAALFETTVATVQKYIYLNNPAQVIAVQRSATGDFVRGETSALADLLSDVPEAIVIVVDDGSGLVDPLTLEITPTAELLLEHRALAAVLSPMVTDGWGVRERALDQAGFLVVPCDPSGLAEFARAVSDFNRLDVERVSPMIHAAEGILERTRIGAYPALLRIGAEQFLSDRPPPRDKVEELRRQLLDYLGEEGLLWLGTLAIYPKVQADLTRAVAAHLPGIGQGVTIDAQKFFALARLPWISQGRLPDWLRMALLNGLSRGQEEQARAAVNAVLSNKNPAGGVLLAFDPPGIGWRELRARLSRSMTPSLSRDAVFLRYMSRGRPLAPNAPESEARKKRPWLRRLITTLALLVTAAASALAFYAQKSNIHDFTFISFLVVAGVVGCWHLFRSHWRDDLVSRSAIILSALVGGLPVMLVIVTPPSSFSRWEDLIGELMMAASLIAAMLGRLALQSHQLESRLFLITDAILQIARAPWTVAVTIAVVALSFSLITASGAWNALEPIGRVNPDVIEILVTGILAFLGLIAIAAGTRGRGMPWVQLAALLVIIALTSYAAGAIIFSMIMFSLAASGSLQGDTHLTFTFIAACSFGLGASTGLKFMASRLGGALSLRKAFVVVTPAAFVWVANPALKWQSFEQISLTMGVLYASPLICMPIIVAAAAVASSPKVSFGATLATCFGCSALFAAAVMLAPSGSLHWSIVGVPATVILLSTFAGGVVWRVAR